MQPTAETYIRLANAADSLLADIEKLDARKIALGGVANIPPKPVWDKENESFGSYIRRKKAWKEKHGALEKKAAPAPLPELNLTKKVRAQQPYIDEAAAARSIAKELGVGDDEARGMQSSMQAWFDGMYESIRDAGNASKAVSDMRADIERVIAGMPKYDGTIFRGIQVRDIDPLDEWGVGSQVDMKGISSWSTSREVAFEFATSNETMTHVVFRCENVGGAAVDHLSELSEDEVLHSSRSVFVVKSIEEKTGVWNVVLEEVQNG